MKKDSEDLYRNNRICGKHFEDNHFMNAAEKNSLVWNAVPTIFDVPNPPPSVTPSRKRPANRTNDRPAKICKGMCRIYIYILILHWFPYILKACVLLIVCLPLWSQSQISGIHTLLNIVSVDIVPLVDTR